MLPPLVNVAFHKHERIAIHFEPGLHVLGDTAEELLSILKRLERAVADQADHLLHLRARAFIGTLPDHFGQLEHQGLPARGNTVTFKVVKSSDGSKSFNSPESPCECVVRVGSDTGKS